MVHFTRIKLVGFKSFVDSTELVIEPGLTGVVGPNGCGKSNLVEALRWVMGETSAKQMRGGEMDDVIFAGTATRPARNQAEVGLRLDNSDRTAPAQFNEYEELDISRRIERGSGSVYRVNGRDVRARDVQLLFADSATGARSTAMVSQGRVSAIIQAKPTQRRMLLEEAAGITGLHSRRHEAELRLRAAEANLARLEDVLITMTDQLSGLRKQARQATRYRNLSEHIRTAEAMQLLLRWHAALDALEDARNRFGAADARVIELTGLAAAAAAAQAEAASVLPELRQGEAASAAELQRLLLARDGLDQEERRIADLNAELNRRLAQIGHDLEREQRLGADAEGFIVRLDEERAALEAARADEEVRRGEAATRLSGLRTEVGGLESALQHLTEQVANAEARKNALDRRIAEITDRRQRLNARLAEAKTQRDAVAAAGVEAATLAGAEADLEAARLAAERSHQAAEDAERNRHAVAEVLTQAQAERQQADTALARLEAEERALAKLVETGNPDQFKPLLDVLAVEPGFEAALGAALGEDLSAAVDESAPVHWRTLAPFDQPAPLPMGAEPLSRFVQGTPVLARRLSQVGVVADAETARRLASELAQGQRLVSRDGGLWRWDGLTVTAGTPTAAAVRLEQRNRLKELRGRLDGARALAEAAARKLDAARAQSAAAQDAERAAREAVRAADRAHNEARDILAHLRQRAGEHATRLAAANDTVERLAADLGETETQFAEADAARAALPDPATGREEVAKRRAELAERRAVLIEAQSTHDRLASDAEARRQRLGAIAGELGSWRQRKEAATRRVGELEARRTEAGDEIKRLAARPTEIAAQRQTLLDAIAGAETRRRDAADKLASAEGRLGEADRALKSAETDLAGAREDRVRTEAAVEQSRLNCQSIAERTTERLNCTPEQLAEAAGLKENDALPEAAVVDTRLDRLLRERDQMGPVNLRAEQEAEEVGRQIDGLTNEKGDLVKAIEKLRRGIAELNREARERLDASFKAVDGHFQELFTRLFGGGRAHLELIDAADPLEAGLEIMASPPGKKLQSLSLLSGGEQALTALALLFAVFLTNPAPICVLDEVDAPLDDANVDRVCSLLEQIAHAGTTRFLVITHHRMTMARMDRLFGVTMSERGISQLVSVDLKRAEALRTA